MANNEDKPFVVMYFRNVYAQGRYDCIGTCSHSFSFATLDEAVDQAIKIDMSRRTRTGDFVETNGEIHVFKGDYENGPCEVFEWKKRAADGSVPSHINDRTMEKFRYSPLWW